MPSADLACALSHANMLCLPGGRCAADFFQSSACNCDLASPYGQRRVLHSSLLRSTIQHAPALLVAHSPVHTVRVEFAALRLLWFDGMMTSLQNFDDTSTKSAAAMKRAHEGSKITTSNTRKAHSSRSRSCAQMRHRETPWAKGSSDSRDIHDRRVGSPRCSSV